MTKILVVDDEQKIREMIRKYAEYEGFQVDEAADGLEAVQKADKNSYDVIVMDIMMPNLDGFSACKEIKKKKDVPVILLSALGEEYDKIHGFDIGVDDYVVKPFSSKELMMRIQAILKRVKKSETPSENFQLGEMVIDYSARIVTIKGERVQLSPKEYELLAYLVKNAGIALTREQLLQSVWGYDFFGDDRTLDTHIKLLRRNLGDYSKYIVTLRGVGYRFEKTDQPEVEDR
jgi:two-component system response regulator ResD